MSFQDGPHDKNRLISGEIWYDELKGRVTFDVDYRPDQYPVWLDWTRWHEHATWGLKNLSCTDLTFPLPQYRARKSLGRPSAFSSSDNIELWEITKNDTFDNETNRIEWSLTTRSMSFQDGPHDKNRLISGEIWYDELKGRVTFDVDYRPDQYPVWLDWTRWHEHATWGLKNLSCTDLTFPLPQYRARKSLGRPSATCNTIDDTRSNEGYEFQVRIKVTGSARIKKLLIRGERIPEQLHGKSSN